ncbi:MAG: hypothetical protein ACXVB9_02165 [Bdellovibrionota bacterium]
MKAATVARKNKSKPAMQGPSLFEVAYLHQLKAELEIFLKSRNFSTIQELQVAFVGSDYQGLMQIKA